MSLEDLCPDGFGPSIRRPLISSRNLAMDAPEDNPDRRWFWTRSGNEWRQVWHSWWRSLELTARSDRAGHGEPQSLPASTTTTVPERKRKRSFNQDEEMTRTDAN